jgi:nicotinate-nucleotide adenylyltransferase
VIGAFGGTFDPPHLGHLFLALEAAYQLDLERVLWVLAGDPPHKPEAPLTPADIRLEMTQAALAGRPGLELSRVDLDRPGPHYAADTMRLLQAAHPGHGWAYLMGGDSLRDLPGWHEPAEFLARCDQLAVMPRPEAPIDLDALGRALPGLGEKLRILRAPYVVLSASDLRRRVREGHPFEHLLAPEVTEVIRAHGLYR